MKKTFAMILIALCMTSLLFACAPAGRETVYCLTKVETVMSDGGVEKVVQIQYDRDGRLLSYQEEAKGQSQLRFQRSYDKQGGYTEKHPETGIVTSYSPEGWLLSEVGYVDTETMTGKEWFSNHYTYDENGDLTTKTRNSGDTVQVTKYRREYAAPGKLAWEEMYSGDELYLRTTHTYDGQGNLLNARLSFTEGSVQEDSYTYDAAGNMLTEHHYSLSSGITTNTGVDYVYDDRGNLLEEHHYTDDHNIHSSSFYTYDDQGNRLTWAQEGNGNKITMEWSYDQNGNVLTFFQDHNGTWERMVYTYDAAGRCLKAVTTSSRFSGDAAVEETYTYDENGNLICHARTDTHGNVAETRYTYQAYRAAGEQLQTILAHQDTVWEALSAIRIS